MIIKSVSCWCEVRETTKRKAGCQIKRKSGARKDEKEEGRKSGKAELLFHVVSRYTVPAVIRKSLST